MIRPGFLIVTADDAARIAAALTPSEDPALRAIAQRLTEGGAKAEKPRPQGRRASELWDFYMEVRKQTPVSVAAFLAQEKDPFPGTEGEPGRNGRATQQQMADRIEVAAFCMLAQPNGVTNDVKDILAQRWNVGEPMVSRTMKLAGERLKSMAQPDDDLRAKVVAHGWNVYDAALRAKRPQAAVGALDGIARNAGLVKGGVEVNILQTPQFIEAQGQIINTVHGALEATAVTAALPDIDPTVIERVLEAARSAVEHRMSTLGSKPLLDVSTD